MDRLTLDSSRKASPSVTPKPAQAQDDRAKQSRAGFAVEAASLTLSYQLTLIDSIDGTTHTSPGARGSGIGDLKGLTPDELRARITAFVKDIFEKNGLTFKELSPDEAQKQIAHDGEQSPEKVAKRIVDFVKAFANGDPKREKLLRGAVEQGLTQAEAAWGDKLPDVSYKTMELVRKGLDDLFAPPKPAEETKPTPRIDTKA